MNPTREAMEAALSGAGVVTMPYKSEAQRKYFHVAEKEGKISPEVVHEWDEASKGKKLPERK